MKFTLLIFIGLLAGCARPAVSPSVTPKSPSSKAVAAVTRPPKIVLPPGGTISLVPPPRPVEFRWTPSRSPHTATEVWITTNIGQPMSLVLLTNGSNWFSVKPVVFMSVRAIDTNTGNVSEWAKAIVTNSSIYQP